MMNKEDIKDALGTAADNLGDAAEKVSKKGQVIIKDQLYLDNDNKGILDAAQEKLASRKLLVFLTATALMLWAGLDADIWGMIAMCYIGGQSAIDFAKSWKHGG
tara:strand:+ start:3396 stop:3707 length:312 start_codon:yes stop_codon:yes gene_type:complete